MTSSELTALLLALALEAERIQGLLCCIVASGHPLPLGAEPWLEDAINGLQKLATQARAVAELAVLRCPEF
jgi:hypothetical protein